MGSLLRLLKWLWHPIHKNEKTWQHWWLWKTGQRMVSRRWALVLCEKEKLRYRTWAEILPLYSLTCHQRGNPCQQCPCAMGWRKSHWVRSQMWNIAGGPSEQKTWPVTLAYSRAQPEADMITKHNLWPHRALGHSLSPHPNTESVQWHHPVGKQSLKPHPARSNHGVQLRALPNSGG